MLYEVITNQQLPPNSHPAPNGSASGTPTDAPLIPNQLTRIDPIQDSAAALNAVFRPLLAEAGSPLQYYVLVSTQWPGGGRAIRITSYNVCYTKLLRTSSGNGSPRL